jgi:transposase InsO family protein
MDLGRYLVEAVVLGGLSPNQLARTHPISRSWLFRLLARYRQGGLAAIEPRSHRPKSCPHQVSPEIEAAILELRAELSAAGFDAGPQTILHQLTTRFNQAPSRTTIWRVLKRHGLITPQPHKRPKASFVRFEAELPNEMWQTDSTHWLLADASDVEILNLIDDHSRFCLASVACSTVKAADALQAFYSAAESHGYPAKFLSDNAAVFSGKSRGGRVALESELDRLGIVSLHSTPYHPQTCGKVERFHQTLKVFLARQAPADSIPHLQLQLDLFRERYNQQRPHRALDGHTPFQAFNARIKATPSHSYTDLQYRIRRDKVDPTGTVTLRFLSQLRHIYVGRGRKGQAVILLIAGANVRICAEDGTPIRELVLDPNRDYQPMTRPRLVANQLGQRSTIT